MCGIAAIVAARHTYIDPATLRFMDAKLAHRGPDAARCLTFDRELAPTSRGGEVALLHRRLAVIDLDARSDQPMRSADGRYYIIYNGEIYNYRELRAELEREGVAFRTQSDTEVLLEGYGRWSEGVLKRLVGMFAFAVLDVRAREIFFARDQFGIKPIYYTSSRSGFALASEIPALLEFGGLDRSMNASRCIEFLADGRSDSGGDTFFAHVKSLRAACYARFSLKTMSLAAPVRYWRPTVAVRDWDRQEAVAELRRLFTESIALHLRSDVPIGTALSGGIDSSSILACARLVGGDNQWLKSFGFAAAGSAVDESGYMAIASRDANSLHTMVHIEPSEVVSEIDDLVVSQGEPFGSLSIYAQRRVMRAAAQAGIKVMLDGQGADELFAGYRPFLARRLSELLRSAKIGEAGRFVASIHALPGSSASLFMQAVEPGLPSSLKALMRRLVGKSLLPSWLDIDALRRSGINVEPRLSPAGPNLLLDALQQSLTTTVLPALLRYEDRNSMAFSIESRVPFLTTAIADFAYSLPSRFLVNERGELKSILREAMRGTVSDTILGRRDKIGFATPDVMWGTALLPWAVEVFESEVARSIPWLDHNGAVSALRRHIASGDRPGFEFWRLVSLVRWIAKFDVKVT